MKQLRASLRNKLVTVFLMPVVVILLLYGLLTYYYARQGLEDELGRRVIAVGMAIASDISENVDAVQIGRLDASRERVRARISERLKRGRDAAQVRRIFIFDRSLQSLVDSEPDVAFGQHIYQLEADKLEIGRVFDTNQAVTSVLFSGEDGTLYKTGYAPITDNGTVIAVLAVEAGADYFDLLTNFATIVAILSLLGIGLVIAIGSLFARRLTRPLNNLVWQAQQLGQTRGNFRLAKNRFSASLSRPTSNDFHDVVVHGDEIQFLTYVFEQMRGNIFQRDKQLQLMLSGVAHEVRNPLGGITLYCGLLREALIREINDIPHDETVLKQLQMLDKIEGELKYLENVVRDFLDFAGASPLKHSLFNIADLLKEIIVLVESDFSDYQCDVTIEVTPPHLQIYADRERIKQALINVLRNAYQACDSHDDEILITAFSGDDTTRTIVVNDTGRGMSQGQLKEIFTPFYTTKQQGSGLGLALVQQIVERHGGSLSIHSEPDRGTTVEIGLPFDNNHNQGSEIPDVPIPDNRIGSGSEQWLGE